MYEKKYAMAIIDTMKGNAVKSPTSIFDLLLNSISTFLQGLGACL